MTKHCIIISHSGYGHTQKLAEAVLAGASEVSGVRTEQIQIDRMGDLPEGAWDKLLAADGIIFGCPTYMGGPSWQFKKFADTSSKQWFVDEWKDKIAAGFTNSGTINGDKFSTIQYLMTLAMQHGMIWVGLGLKPSNAMAAGRNDINYLGGFSGLIGQSPADSNPDQGPLPGDLETGRLFGKRVAEKIVQLRA